MTSLSNTSRRFWAVALLTALLSLTLRTAPAGAAGAPPSVTRATLANGMRVIIVRDTLAPVVATFLNYNVGSDDENITGLAHAQEHMMFRGSKSLSASQFSEVTALTGGVFNANTQNRITQYYFVMPSRDLDIALRLDASRAHGLLDSQKLWDEERGAIEQEVTRDNSDAGYRLYVKTLHQLMAGTPYADAGLGTLHSFGKQINAPQLKAFYGRWYHPNNAILVIAGNVQPEQALRQVRATFGKLPAAKLPGRKPVHLKPLRPATFHDVSDNSYTMAFLGYRFPGYQDPDYAAGQVLGDVLNSQRSDLNALAYSGKALAVGFSAQTFTKAGIGFVEADVATTTPPEKAVEMVRSVIEGYRKSGVPADLVEAAKRREVAAAQFRLNSIQGLGDAWSSAVAVEGRKSPDDDVRAIQRVTVADVNRVLRKWLVNQTATVAYAVPRPGGKVSHAGGQGGENNTVIPSKQEPLPSWARQMLAHLRAPEQTLHPTSYVLSNGIRLIVQPEAITRTVVLHGLIRNNTGMQEAPGTDGVATVTESLLPYGTTTYSRLAFQAELDKIAASVDTGTSFSLAVQTAHFDRGVQLLADDELHPRFAADDFKVVQQQTYDSVVGSQKTPDHVAAVERAKALYPAGDPARRHATPATVKSLTLDQVKQWYATAYRPDMATIVVVGDVQPEQARAVVERWFGGWKASGPKPNVDPTPAPNNQPATINVPDATRVQDAVSLNETLKLTRTDADYAPLAVADTVLSGGFYASMLYHDLRQVSGYVYYVSTDMSVGKTRSTYSVYYGSMPDKVGAAETLAIADLKRLQTKLLSKDRVRRAQALLLGRVPIHQQSYSGVAGLLLGYGSEGLPLDQNLRDARRELAVTPTSLRAAMRKWIRPDGFVRTVVGPAPK